MYRKKSTINLHSILLASSSKHIHLCRCRCISVYKPRERIMSATLCDQAEEVSSPQRCDTDEAWLSSGASDWRLNLRRLNVVPWRAASSAHCSRVRLKRHASFYCPHPRWVAGSALPGYHQHHSVARARISQTLHKEQTGQRRHHGCEGHSFCGAQVPEFGFVGRGWHHRGCTGG